ncbi:MAG TPA: Spy/CpxP family protein refolding chaperone [Steroidobacteraceae bacterium]|nr:Spy/CpxP family protein refolding chaperone [Steroidobacteraceae bacterium]
MKPMRMVFAGALMAGAGLLTATSALLTTAAADTAAAEPPADATGAGMPPEGAPGAGPHGWGHGPGGDGPEHLYGKLNLSAEQKASIKSIMTAARPQMMSLHDRMRANHLKLMQSNPDDPNYGSVVAEVAQSNAALASERTTRAAELRTQMYAVLTPAQKTQLTALEAQWAAQEPHHGPGRHGPREPE